MTDNEVRIEVVPIKELIDQQIDLFEKQFAKLPAAIILSFRAYYSLLVELTGKSFQPETSKIEIYRRIRIYPAYLETIKQDAIFCVESEMIPEYIVTYNQAYKK